MPDDLVARLRARADRKWPNDGDRQHSLFGQAADEIVRLQAENEALLRNRGRLAWLLRLSGKTLREAGARYLDDNLTSVSYAIDAAMKDHQ